MGVDSRLVVGCVVALVSVCVNVVLYRSGTYYCMVAFYNGLIVGFTTSLLFLFWVIYYSNTSCVIRVTRGDEPKVFKAILD